MNFALPSPIEVRLPVIPDISGAPISHDPVHNIHTYAEGHRYQGELNSQQRWEGDGIIWVKEEGSPFSWAIRAHNFQDGRIEGQFEFERSDSQIKFKGNLHNQQVSGYGVYEWDQNVYEGTFVSGLASGNGRWLIANSGGDVIKGLFDHGRVNGEATITYSNGDCYEGTYLNGIPVGKGKMLFANQKIIMNRLFNQSGVDRSNTGDLEKFTFDITKKNSKSDVVVHKNTNAQTLNIRAGSSANRKILDSLIPGLSGASKKTRSVRMRKPGLKCNKLKNPHFANKVEINSRIKNSNN